MDDNQDTLDAMRILLESWGLRVTATGSGAAAFESFRANVPSIVMSDIGMPHVDGLALARALRAFEAGSGAEPALLIAITGYASEGDRQRASAAGFDAYLTKPIDFSSLERILDGPDRPAAERTDA